MTRYIRAAAIIAICLPLLAWDTRTTQNIAWHSPYVTESGNAGQAGQPGTTRNAVREHTLISHIALEELGVGDLYGAGGEAARSVVDLNASHFREDELRGVHPRGDNADTLLEERRIAAPANMVGLADYSYSVVDWLNKTHYCPATPYAAELDRCHEFKGWLGALNSVHFGSQATQMYARYHRIALELAGRAREMRERMSEEERAFHRDSLLEAELEALTYEAFAQHFLQDRWSIGHMFERWNGGDAQQAAYPLDEGMSRITQWQTLVSNILVAGVAGGIHGWEGIARDIEILHGVSATGDPMSSPSIEDDHLVLAQYRHVSMGDNSPLLDGVGDERFIDMRNGSFGAGYGDLDRNLPMDVSNQYNAMMTCSKAGWADVIREFGLEDGAYGAHGAALSADAPAFDPLARETCWDMWATNASMAMGFYGQDTRAMATLAVTLFELSIDFIANAAEQIETAATGGIPELPMARSDLVGLGWHMWRRALEDPHGTDLAQGGIGELWGVETGNHYELPDFAEPVDFDQLPDIDRRGIDRRAVYGAFSQAHSDHWCEEREDFLNEIRAPIPRSEERRLDQQVCQFVAGLAYQGTHPGQETRYARSLHTDGGEEVRSMCAIRGTSESSHQDNPEDPFFIDVGYVSRHRTDAPPHTQHAIGSREIAEWCARTPVLRTVPYEGDTEMHLVAYVEPDDTEVEIDAYDLGAREGRIIVEDEDSGEQFDAVISDWRDDRVVLAEGGGLVLDTDRRYRLDVETPDGRTSVGLFRLHVMDPPELGFVRVSLAGQTPCGIDPPEFDLYNLAEIVPMDLIGPSSADRMQAVRDVYAEMAEELEPYLESEAGCIRELASARASILESWLRSREPARDPESEIYQPCCTPYAWPFREMLTLPDHPAGFEGNFYLVYAEELDDIRADLAHNIRVMDFWIERILGDEETVWTLPDTAVDLIREMEAELASPNPDGDRARALERQARAALRLEPLDPGQSEDDWLETRFIDAATHPRRAPLPRAGAHLVAWSAIGPNLRVDGDVLHERILASLEGLPAWAQIEHTTFHHIMPGWVSGPRGEFTARWAARFSRPWMTRRQFTQGPQTQHRGELNWPNEDARLAASNSGHRSLQIERFSGPDNASTARDDARAGLSASATPGPTPLQPTTPGPDNLPVARIPTYDVRGQQTYELGVAGDGGPTGSNRPTKPQNPETDDAADDPDGNE